MRVVSPWFMEKGNVSCLCGVVKSGANDMQAMREGGFHGAVLHASLLRDSSVE